MKKAIIIIISILFIITAGSIFALNKLGSEVIDTLIDSEIASLEQQMESDISGIEDDTVSDDSTQQEVTPNSSIEPDSEAVTDSTNKDNRDEIKKPDKKKVVTVKQIQEIKDQVTMGDRMTAATLVMKRLSSDDIATLKELLSGGLTPEKQKEAVKIAYARFTAEEIVEIKELYHKYMKK